MNVARLSALHTGRLYPQDIIIIIIIINLTGVGLTPGGSSTVHVYTQTLHRIQRTEHT
jgi:hypothetical protein